ncbi:MAG: RNA-binding S4 domain-containing protein [Caldilineaceae bacterium]|nr:RNA-binding S4 domain-containing protein [Caldilineaceae bacterium]
MEATIKLDQFLKREGLVFSGGEAKHLIQSGMVWVNGEVETRRGRKLHPGDRVTLDDTELVVGPLPEV